MGDLVYSTLYFVKIAPKGFDVVDGEVQDNAAPLPVPMAEKMKSQKKKDSIRCRNSEMCLFLGPALSKFLFVLSTVLS